MLSNNDERRKHVRYDFPKRIEYVLSPKTSDETFYGVTVNISDSGLCLYIFKLLPEGQKVAFKNILPVSYQRAMVRWIKELDNDFYQVGMMFV